MIVENHHIAHRNVVSKYYRFLPEEITAAFDDLDTILEKNHYHTNGNLFFSINSDPTEEIMTAEVFVTVDEDNFTIETDEQLFFKSYFSIYPMIMTRITENVEEQSQVKYWELMDYIKKHGLKQRTPVFVEYKQSHSGKNYVEMSIGV